MERAHTKRIARKPQDAPGGPQCSPKREVCHCESKVAPQGVLVARFEIPYPETKRAMSEWNRRFSLNAYYAGKHYQQRRRDAEFWHLLTKKIYGGMQGSARPGFFPGEDAIFFQ